MLTESEETYIPVSSGQNLEQIPLRYDKPQYWLENCI